MLQNNGEIQTLNAFLWFCRLYWLNKLSQINKDTLNNAICGTVNGVRNKMKECLKDKINELDTRILVIIMLKNENGYLHTDSCSILSSWKITTACKIG